MVTWREQREQLTAGCRGSVGHPDKEERGTSCSMPLKDGEAEPLYSPAGLVPSPYPLPFLLPSPSPFPLHPFLYPPLPLTLPLPPLLLFPFLARLLPSSRASEDRRVGLLNHIARVMFIPSYMSWSDTFTSDKVEESE